MLGNTPGPSTGSVGIGQVPTPQPQTVQHHPPAPSYNQSVSSQQVQGLMSPAVNSAPPPQPQPPSTQPGAPAPSLVSSGPTSPIDGATSTTQVQIGNNGNNSSQSGSQPVSAQNTTNYYNSDSGGNCSQYTSGMDYNNGMNMPSTSSQATTSSEGNINQSGYSSWNGTGNSTVSYTQNAQSSSSGPELSNHPGYSKSSSYFELNLI